MQIPEHCGQEQGRGLRAGTLHDGEKHLSSVCLGTSGRQAEVILSPGKATSARAYLLPRSGWLEVFRTICFSAAWAERTLCVRDRSTWARLCSLDLLDQVLT